MQRQTMRVDFDLKTQVKAPFRYKQGEVDQNGIEFELVNVDLVGLSGAVYALTPSESKLEPQSLVITGNKAVYIPPTNEAGDYKLELVMYNTNGKTKSADVVMTVVESISASIADYETLYEQVTRKEAEFTTNENTRISNENTRIANENARKSAETNRVASMTDIEKRFSSLTTAQQQQAEVADARMDTLGFVHANLKTRLDEDFKELASKIPTDVAMNGYESVTTNDTVSGEVSSAVLSGNTLVNLGRVNPRTDGVPRYEPLVECLNAGSMMKPSTIYTVVVFSTNDVDVRCFFSGKYTVDTVHTIHAKGVSIFKKTTNESITQTRYFLNNYDDTRIDATKYKTIILEGDHTDKPLEFFEGLKSVELSEIESTNADNTKSSKVTLPSPITLRSLPNGVADTYDVDTGVLTRRCGEVVLNGSESVAKDQELTNTVAFIVVCKPLKDSYSSNKIGHGWCDKFADNGSAIYNSLDEEGINPCASIEHVRIRIAKSKLPTPDVAGFKAWLTQNPTTVVYQLATPTTEYIENNGQLRSYDSQTTVFANSIVPVKFSGNIPVNYASTLATTMQSLDELTQENRELRNTIDELSNNVNQIHAFMYRMMSAETLEEPEID